MEVLALLLLLPLMGIIENHHKQRQKCGQDTQRSTHTANVNDRVLVGVRPRMCLACGVCAKDVFSSKVINLLGGMLRGGELSPTLLFENDNLTDLQPGCIAG